jgi:hypothetical protein
LPQPLLDTHFFPACIITLVVEGHLQCFSAARTLCGSPGHLQCFSAGHLQFFLRVTCSFFSAGHLQFFLRVTCSFFCGSPAVFFCGSPAALSVARRLGGFNRRLITVGNYVFSEYYTFMNCHSGNRWGSLSPVGRSSKGDILSSLDFNIHDGNYSPLLKIRVI